MSIPQQSLTGLKDVDRFIIDQLSDREVLEFCKTSKYSNEKICDETFFRNRVITHYSNTLKYKDKVKKRNWKNYFLSLVYYIDKLNSEYQFNYLIGFKNKDGSPELEYLARKLAPNYYKYDKNMALKNASRNGRLEVVKYLVEQEQAANIHAIDDEVFILASYYGHLDVVKYLVEQGANIHANDDGPLRIASENGNLPVVKYLVKQGANIHANDDGALRFAIGNRQLEVVKYLKSLA